MTDYASDEEDEEPGDGTSSDGDQDEEPLTNKSSRRSGTSRPQ